jgi:hypothetical protein
MTRLERLIQARDNRYPITINFTTSVGSQDLIDG